MILAVRAGQRLAPQRRARAARKVELARRRHDRLVQVGRSPAKPPFHLADDPVRVADDLRLLHRVARVEPVGRVVIEGGQRSAEPAREVLVKRRERPVCLAELDVARAQLRPVGQAVRGPGELDGVCEVAAVARVRARHQPHGVLRVEEEAQLVADRGLVEAGRERHLVPVVHGLPHLEAVLVRNFLTADEDGVGGGGQRALGGVEGGGIEDHGGSQAAGRAARRRRRRPAGNPPTAQT